jgi:hypothetical protein
MVLIFVSHITMNSTKIRFALRTLSQSSKTAASVVSPSSIIPPSLTDVHLLNERLLKCSTPLELEQLILHAPDEHFNDFTCSSSLSQFAKMQVKTVTPAMQRILLFSETVPFKPKSLSITCQAFALGKFFPNSTIPPSFLVQIEHALPYFNAPQIADTLLALAELTPLNLSSKLLDVLCFEIVDQEMFYRFSQHMLPEFLPSFVKLKYTPSTRFVQDLCKEMELRDFERFSPHHIWTILSSFRDLNLPVPSRLMQHFAKQVLIMSDLSAWNVPELTLFLSSVCTTKHVPQQDIVPYLQKELSKRPMKDFFLSSLLLVLQSLVHCKHGKYVDDFLLSRMMKDLEKRDWSFASVAEVSTAISCLSGLRLNSETLLAQLSGQLASRMRECSNSQLISVLNDLSVLCPAISPEFTDACAKELGERFSELTFSELVQASFAFAILCPSPLSNHVETFFQREYIRGSSHVSSSLVEAERLLLVPRTRLTESLCAGLSVDQEVDSTSAKKVNKLHQQLFDLLSQELHMPCELNVETKSKLVLDMVVTIPNKNRQVVIEFESPDQFLRDQVQRVGSRRLRQRYIQHELGMSVVGFPLRGFGNLSINDKTKRVQEFLGSKSMQEVL